MFQRYFLRIVIQNVFGTQTSLHPGRVTIRRIIYFAKLVLLLRSPLYEIEAITDFEIDFGYF